MSLSQSSAPHRAVPERFNRLSDETAELSMRFCEAGFQLYLVGGSVRDAIGDTLDPLADLDFTTNAKPEEIESTVNGWCDAVYLQGKRFGTIGVIKGGKHFEITTHRAEAYEPSSRKPEVQFSGDVEIDLSRRDFTVNAMALKLPELVLIDPYGGATDLAAGVLKTPLKPEESFGDDPLRMMRAARFIAGRGLVPTDELTAAVRALSTRLGIVSRERIRDELDKLMLVSDPSAGLWFLVSNGLADQFLPEIPALSLEQDPIHRHKDVLQHTIAVVSKTSAERILRLAALFHDIGKPATRSMEGGKVSFHHHEAVGARMTRKRMRELKYSTDDVENVSRLVDLHLRFHTYQMGWTDSAVRRYVRDAGPLLGRLNELTRCDCTTRNEAKARALAKRMDELESRIDELAAQEELDSLRPDIDGNEVMEHLGLVPGRVIGEAMDFLMEIRLEEGPIGKAASLERLDQWWADRHLGDGND